MTLSYAILGGARIGRRSALGRCSATTRVTPCLGRNVIEGINSSLNPGLSANRNCCATVARINIASIMANWLPMQTLGPPPKGK